MRDATHTPRSSTAKGGPVDVLTCRPTVAGSVPHGMGHRFEKASIQEAEFLRLPPAKGRCALTGLSRSGMIETAEVAGAIVRVRLPGRARGAVLIDRPKLVAFLHKLAEVQAAERAAAQQTERRAA